MGDFPTHDFGAPERKIGMTAATASKFWSFYPLTFFGLIQKCPGYNPFSPTDELVFTGQRGEIMK